MRRDYSSNALINSSMVEKKSYYSPIINKKANQQKTCQ